MSEMFLNEKKKKLRKRFVIIVEMIEKLNILFNVMEDSQKRFIYMPRHMSFGSEIFQFDEDIMFFVTPQHSLMVVKMSVFEFG